MKKAVRLPLIEARKRQQWSQQELADRIGTTRVNISRWEQGQTTPGPYFRAKLCELFGMSAQDLGLFGEQPCEEPQETSPLSLAQTSHPDPDPDEPLWHVPYPRNPFFTGRGATLQHLHETLHQQRSLILSQSLAISGLGGIGKTQIALEYAYRYRQEYHFIFWASAATHEALLTDYMAIADHLQLPERQDQQKVLKAVKQWFATHREWLLILDNADELAIVSDFVPPERSGHLLLTSRAQALGSLAQRVEVEKMGMAEATLFLLHRAKLLATGAFLDQAAEEHLVAAEAIAIDMDFLPLALDQAGAYIEEIGCSPADYLELYRTHRRELLRRRGHVPTTYPESVATTWSLSFQKVERVNPAAAELLHLCAFLEPDMIPEELLTEGSVELGPVLQSASRDALLLNEAIEELRKFSLVQRDPETKTLRVHRLVQAVIKDATEKVEQRCWAERAMRITNAVFPEQVKMTTWLRCRRFLPQAQICSELIREYTLDNLEAASLLHRTAIYLKDYGLYTQAEFLAQQALRIRELILQPEHPDVAPILYQLGTLSRFQGNYSEAENYFQRALFICQQGKDPEHIQTIQTLMAKTFKELGNVHVDQGKYREAENAFRRAIELQERFLETDDDTLLIATLNGLGNVYLQQGKYREAESTYQRALQTWKSVARPDDPAMAHALSNLAILYYEEARYEKAKPLLIKAIEIRERAFGSEHPQIATSLTILGAISLMQGKYAEAEQLHQRAFRIWEKALGPEHLQIAYAYIWLGKVYRAQGKYEKAEQALQRALGMREQALGSEHAQLVSPLATLGGVYRDQGKDKEAERCLRDALRIGEQTMGHEHPDMIFPLTELGSLQRERENYEEAEGLFQRAVKLCEHHEGNEHPQMASLLNELAEWHRQQGRYPEAEPLYRRALQIWEQQFGPTHPQVASPLTGLANLSRDLGRYTEAEQLYRRALHIQEQALDTYHPEIAKTLHHFAVLREAQGKQQEAKVSKLSLPDPSEARSL